MPTEEFDVIISGYGPTGQALASILAREGHSVCVLERWPELYGLPRLCTIDGEAARIIQAAGDIDAALVDSNPCRRYFLVNEDHQVLIDLDWTADHVCGFPLRISMHQPDIETAMDAGARERGATILQGWEADHVEQDENGVTVRARSTAEGRENDVRTVRGRYLIGSDGAKSFVGRTIGVEYQDFPFRNAWVSVDAVRKRTLPTIGGVSEDLRVPVVVCAPEGRTHASIPIGATRLRFEFLVDPDSEHDEHLKQEVGYQYLKDVHGLTEDDVEIYRQVIYPFAGRLAKRWRVGRVLLAGDAAHLMTPFLGQGACSGLRDSVNLAWKLDLILRGLSDDRLLDTYEDERLPHVTGHVAGSDALGAMACEPDPQIAAERDKVLLAGQGPPPPADPVLTTGVLHRDGAEPQLPVGDLGPQGRVRYEGHEGRFDDVIGWGFQLVLRDRDPRSDLDEEQRAFLAQINGHAVGVGAAEVDGVAADLDGAYERFFAAHEIEGYLARPDFTVFGVVRKPGDVAALIDDLRAQLHVAVPGHATR